MSHTIFWTVVIIPLFQLMLTFIVDTTQHIEQWNTMTWERGAIYSVDTIFITAHQLSRKEQKSVIESSRTASKQILWWECCLNCFFHKLWPGAFKPTWTKSSQSAQNSFLNVHIYNSMTNGQTPSADKK